MEVVLDIGLMGRMDGVEVWGMDVGAWGWGRSVKEGVGRGVCI